MLYPHRQCLLAQAGLAAAAGPQVLPAARGRAVQGVGTEEARALRRAHPRRASCRGWCPSWRARSWPGSWETPGRSRTCCASCAMRTAMTAWCGLPLAARKRQYAACRTACMQAHDRRPSICWSGPTAHVASEPRIWAHVLLGCAQPPGMRSRAGPLACPHGHSSQTVSGRSFGRGFFLPVVLRASSSYIFLPCGYRGNRCWRAWRSGRARLRSRARARRCLVSLQRWAPCCMPRGAGGWCELRGALFLAGTTACLSHHFAVLAATPTLPPPTCQSRSRCACPRAGLQGRARRG